MARRSGYTTASMRYAASVDRANRQAQREAERQQRELQRAIATAEKDRMRAYAESRQAQAEALTQDAESRVSELENLLADSLRVHHFLLFSSLKTMPERPEWNPGGLATPYPAPRLEDFMPAEPTGLTKVFGKAKYEAAVAEGRAQYETACRQHEFHEAGRESLLEAKKNEWRAAMAQAKQISDQQNAEVDEFEKNFAAGDPLSVALYYELALKSSDYPQGMDCDCRLAYIPESRQLVVEYELPSVSIVPPIKTYRYVKTTDQITETARPATQIKQLYASVIAQLALRVVHELFEIDDGRYCDTIVFNGVLSTTDPATGQAIRPCLITLRTTANQFETVDLSNVEPLACLKYLSAGVSKSPAELVPVRPVLEFDMVDPRFVAESDALSALDERPNLMELTPTEFESLIQNLFTKMGLETRQTRASRDGGVDCVAWDTRPIFGGKVVIQAKRYKNTVGVSAVRDLYGTLQNEGASKGILVTTSGYGQASFDFANNKPIELIDGANLLYLLKEYAGIDAKIEPPDTWVDAVPDMPDAMI